MNRQVNYPSSFLVLRLEVCVREANGVYLVDWSYKLHLFRPTQYRFVLFQILPLHVGNTFRPISRLSSDTPIQIPYKERYNKIEDKGHLIYIQYFLIMLEHRL